MGSGYWIHGKTSLIDGINPGAVLKQGQNNEITCLTMGITYTANSPIEITPKDCTLKRSVMCMLDVPEVPILSTTTIPPKFPCISSNQEVTKKRKREVESAVDSRHDKPNDGKCKDDHGTPLQLVQTSFLKCIFDRLIDLIK